MARADRAEAHGSPVIDRALVQPGKSGGKVTGWVDDLTHALRSLARRPRFTVFAALTVALGVGPTTAMFSTVESILLNPLPHDGGNRMISLFQQSDGQELYMQPSREQVALWSSQGDLFAAVEPWTFRDMTLTGLGDARQVRAGLIRPSFHDLTGRVPRIGRTFTADELAGDGARVVLLSHSFWERTYGASADVLGRAVTLDGEPWTVVGVMPPNTPLPGFGLLPVDVWRPLAADVLDNASATGILREGVSLDRVNARLAALPGPEETADRHGVALLVAEQVGRGLEGSLGMLMGAVVLLLLIVCVNVSNLLLFRANARERETAIRAALGSGRGRLVRQLLVESVVLALLGGVFGIAFARLAQTAISALRPARLEVLDNVAMKGSVLGFALSVTLLAGLLFGLIPAIRIARPGALDALRSGTRAHGSVRDRRALWGLVAGEVALSFALLVGSLTVVFSLLEKQGTDVAYRADEVLVMKVMAPAWRHERPEERRRLFMEMKERLGHLPGVIGVSNASGVPPSTGIVFGRFQVEGGEPSTETLLLHGPGVDPDYFATLGQEIVRGRAFTAEDVAAEDRRMILGAETAERLFADRDPVGARFRMGRDEDWTTVVGVATDVAMIGLAATSRPLQMYYPFASDTRAATFLLRVEADHPERDQPISTLLPLMRDVARSTDADLRVDELAVAEDLLRATLEGGRFVTAIMTAFAALALLLASVGLYGVVSQVVGQRTRELGIRMALGARRTSIVSIVLRGVGSATLSGVAAGAILTLFAMEGLRSHVFGLDPSTPRTFLLAAAGLAVTALLAAYAPSKRASRLDPVEAMRVE